MQSKGFTTIVDFTPTGIDLGDFLNESKKKRLKDMRVFYIIRSVAEKNIIKFGVSDGAGFSRLNSYAIQYGNRGKNRCTGVDLLFLGGTKQNENVAWTNSRVYKMEKQLKENLKTVTGRGDERTYQSLDTIKTEMLKNKSEDKVVEPRRSQRTTFSEGDIVDYKWDKVNKNEEWFGKVMRAKVIKVNSTTVDLKFAGDTVLRAQKTKVITR